MEDVLAKLQRNELRLTALPFLHLEEVAQANAARKLLLVGKSLLLTTGLHSILFLCLEESDECH